ncbi:unnamed protein product [Vicia faba]|uniref:UBX domain-containing protein n=1 Tax=Vicia faba TaxID=3906 RepID=A0AAV1AH13_VICFA|nr:unnamed protein product [Vicia faba]
MATPNQETVDTFISITGVSEPVALQKLQEHGGSLNEAVNAFFSEGDRNSMTSSASFPQGDFMDIDDDPRDDEILRPPSLLSAARNLHPFSLLDPTLGRSIFDTHLGSTNQRPFVTHPREVREIPIEVKDGSQSTPQAGHTPIVEDVTGTVHAQDSSNDIEEAMIRAAIEASKREAEENYTNHELGRQDLSESGPNPRQTFVEDPELAHAVSLSLKTAEQEKARRVQEGDVGAPSAGPSKAPAVELGEVSSNGRLQAGSLSFKDEDEDVDVEEMPLVRHRSRNVSLGSTGPGKDVDVIESSTLPSTTRQESSSPPPQNDVSFPSDEWGGISSVEHDEAVMLEAAMFGGIPEGSGYRHAYAPHEFMQNRGFNPQPAPLAYRPPSPSLETQRLIREQQDDEYLASLQADREKELKAIEEAEAAREEERRKAEESQRKLQEEQELETQLAAKEVSLPPEPASGDDNAVNLLVKMPDGSRRGRRFLRSDKLQSLFDFIDIGRQVKPSSYRLVRPYPRRAFGVGESAVTLEEVGLTNKQEALFLELV